MQEPAPTTQDVVPPLDSLTDEQAAAIDNSIKDIKKKTSTKKKLTELLKSLKASFVQY